MLLWWEKTLRQGEAQGLSVGSRSQVWGPCLVKGKASALIGKSQLQCRKETVSVLYSIQFLSLQNENCRFQPFLSLVSFMLSLAVDLSCVYSKIFVENQVLNIPSRNRLARSMLQV